MIKIEGTPMDVKQLHEFFHMIDQTPIQWNFILEDHNLVDNIKKECKKVGITKNTW